MKSRTRISVHQTQRMALTTGLATSIRILRADAAQPVHTPGQAALRDFLARVGLPRMIAITPMLKAALTAR